MRCKPSALVAVFAVLPFVVGFTPPEEEGTHVSVSAGQGRFLTSSGCSNPRLVEFTDQQAGAYHVWKKLEHPYAPRIGSGLDVNAFQSEEKECTEEDCLNSTPGWERNRPVFAVSPYMTFDWRWVGLGVGSNIPFHPDFELYSVGLSSAFQVLPFRGSLRVGPADFLYGSIEVFSGQPLSSGLVFPVGIGGRLLGFDLWGGGIPTIGDGSAASGTIARRFGPVRLRLSATYAEESDTHTEGGFDPGDEETTFTVTEPHRSFAVGIDYHLPW